MQCKGWFQAGVSVAEQVEEPLIEQLDVKDGITGFKTVQKPPQRKSMNIS
jgi:hypothetical protein